MLVFLFVLLCCGYVLLGFVGRFFSLFPNASSWHKSIYQFAFLSVIAIGLTVVEVCILKWS